METRNPKAVQGLGDQTKFVSKEVSNEGNLSIATASHPQQQSRLSSKAGRDKIQASEPVSPPCPLTQGQEACHAVHVTLFAWAHLTTHEPLHLVLARPRGRPVRVVEYLNGTALG